jgi:uncharacterized protein YdaU (DUF1376 family)
MKISPSCMDLSDSFSARTSHLSLEEIGAYGRLFGHYSGNEFGLPADLNRCYSITRASSKSERAAVEFVLSEFFRVSDDGRLYIHV